MNALDMIITKAVVCPNYNVCVCFQYDKKAMYKMLCSYDIAKILIYVYIYFF